LIEYVEIYHRGDLFKFSYELRRWKLNYYS
jgi:hypothetical protein